MRKLVTKCICHRISFEELQDYAKEHNMQFEDLISERKCCCGCQMCKPYVDNMLRTGETAFVPGDYVISDNS
ncbi:MAG: hypothetical protein WD037_09140 [Balneolales bacterium]